jgi:hypothetical protein
MHEPSVDSGTGGMAGRSGPPGGIAGHTAGDPGDHRQAEAADT